MTMFNGLIKFILIFLFVFTPIAFGGADLWAFSVNPSLQQQRLVPGVPASSLTRSGPSPICARRTAPRAG